MDIDQLCKLATAAAAAITCAVGLWLASKKIYTDKLATLHSNYEFSADFFERVERLNLLGQPMHELVKQKAHRVITGSPHLKNAEVEYLISLENPLNAIEDYLFSRANLRFDEENTKKIIFQKSLESEKSRKCHSIAYFIVFFIFYCTPFSPIFLWAFSEISGLFAIRLMVVAAPFWTIALLTVQASRKFRRAVDLVRRQRVRLPPPR